MKFRQLTIVLGIVLFIGSIILFRVLASGPDEESTIRESIATNIGVSVLETQLKDITADIVFTGAVIPARQIQLFAEVSGVLLPTENTFKAGTRFEEGELILHIDDREQIQAVATLKAQFQALLTQALADMKLDYPERFDAWNEYLESVSTEQTLPDLPTMQDRTFRLFLTGRNVLSNYHSIKQAEIRLSKYRIVAPFDGVLTQSLLDPGTLVRPNQPLGQFTQTNAYEIEASINANDRFYINTGDNVELSLDGDKAFTFTATVERINATIDNATQTLLVYLSANDQRLLPGKFVQGSIQGETFENVFKVASKSLIRNDRVFVVRDSVAIMQSIKYLISQGDSVIISGLSNGELVVNEFRDASFEGTKVQPISE